MKALMNKFFGKKDNSLVALNKDEERAIVGGAKEKFEREKPHLNLVCC